MSPNWSCNGLICVVYLASTPSLSAVYFYTPDLSPRAPFGDAHFPQIDTITQGGKRRKSENVCDGEWDQTDPGPVLSLTISPSISSSPHPRRCFVWCGRADGGAAWEWEWELFLENGAEFKL
ncbi:hypothetical protein NQD34_013867 [Periophthalmus magnuspinnatus]|nr:hypothetical protein NQD34_013867 [Periophthalmus magnuspinnatus]